MATIFLDSSCNDRYNEHQFFSPSIQHHEHQFLSPHSQASPPSQSLTCHLFLNPITTHDQDGVFNRESHPSQYEDDSCGSQAYDNNCVENQDERLKGNGKLKFSLWNKETYEHVNDDHQLKWMSSKMRVMLKMKNTNPTKLNTLQSTTKDLELEDHHDHKEPTSSPMDESTPYSNTIHSTSPIRVCSDCNTTKTPLWRSGPQGPKSLCNACGIRQRKARKAMAMAAVETNKSVFSDKPTSLKATKILQKDNKKVPNNGIFRKLKKKQYPAARTNRVEELLVRLSKKLAFHRVFPQDEKEAAILLMALSCGHVHQ